MSRGWFSAGGDDDAPRFMVALEDVAAVHIETFEATVAQPRMKVASFWLRGASTCIKTRVTDTEAAILFSWLEDT